jgi:flagellar hook-basal body complex protein FliE
MIKAEEAGIATDLLLEIRNRLINAYQETMRMPV